MVCLGNICRSPLAEGIMKEKIKKAGLDWTVDSAGTSGWHAGELPDARSIQVARKNGVDITDQRSRQFLPEDLDTFDTIFVMDHQNHRDVLFHAAHEGHRQKVRLLLDEMNDEAPAEVPDPYYDGGFDHVYRLIDDACERFIQRNLSAAGERGTHV